MEQKQDKINEYKAMINRIEVQIDIQKKRLRELADHEEKRLAIKGKEKENIYQLIESTVDSNTARKINDMEINFIKRNNKESINYEESRNRIIKTIEKLEIEKEKYQQELKKIYLENK